MSALLLLRGLLFAGECLLASLLLPLAAFAAGLLLRRRAALRHLVWTTLFGVLAVLPLAALLLPPRRIVEHVAAPLSVAAAPIASAPVMAAPPPLLTPEHAVLLLAGLWLAGLFWQGLRLGVGGLGLMRLRRQSTPFAAALASGCEVRLSAGEDGPSTFGILRPLVLLPRSAPNWPAARLDAVLRHETAHVARRDTASQLLARLVCAFYWPNPLLWLGLRALRREAEIAADDAVLAGGMAPSLYAAELVGLAAERRGIVPGIAMAGSPLGQRVQAVLATNSSRKGVTRMDMAKTVCLGLAATLLLGAARFDFAVAQDAPVVEATPRVTVETQVDTKVKASPIQKKLLRKEAEKATEDATRALAAVEQARKAAQDVASVQIRRAMTGIGNPTDAVAATRSLAAIEQAENAARDVAMAQVGSAMQRASAGRDRADAERQRLNLAEATPPAQAESSISGDAQSTSSINGVTTTIRSGNHSGAPQNSNSNSNSNSDPDRASGLTRSQPRETARMDRITSDIDAQVDSAVAAAVNRPEVREAIREAVRTALAEAGRKIDAASAEAKAQAGTPAP